jgi:hypothetical protein
MLIKILYTFSSSGEQPQGFVAIHAGTWVIHGRLGGPAAGIGPVVVATCDGI